MGYRVTRALVDTHALVWWLEGREKLSAKARAVIEDSETDIYISAASAWELAIKSQIGKFRANVLVRNLDHQIQEEGFIELPISIEHALRAGLLSGGHKDPFDRMLIAQAQVENLPVITKDDWFDDYSVQRIW
jgi:PIN domain nuclease of toxin-antitoxin system